MAELGFGGWLPPAIERGEAVVRLVGGGGVAVQVASGARGGALPAKEKEGRQWLEGSRTAA
jgi:hypothetical protein